MRLSATHATHVIFPGLDLANDRLSLVLCPSPSTPLHIFSFWLKSLLTALHISCSIRSCFIRNPAHSVNTPCIHSDNESITAIYWISYYNLFRYGKWFRKLEKKHYFGPHLPLLFEEDWLWPSANLATPTVGEGIKVEQSIPGSRWHRCRCTAPAVRCLPLGGSWSCLQRLFWAGSSANPVGLWARRCNMSGPGWWCCPSRSIPQTLSLTRRSTPRTQPPDTTEIFSMSELHFAFFFYSTYLKKCIQHDKCFSPGIPAICRSH